MLRRSALLAVVLVAAVPATAHGAFSPKKLKGTYLGSWTNKTFNVTGDLSLKATAARSNSRLAITADVEGTVYGCPDPEPVKLTMKKGTGANRWNRKGFHAVKKDATIGSLDIRYSDRTHRLRGSGSAPSCAPDVTWTFDGSWNGGQITGVATITLPGGSTAVTDVVARKQP